MNPSIRRLIEAKAGKQKQVKPDPTSVKLVLDAPDENEHATDQKPIQKSVTEAKADVAVVAFGRLNPPTVGHEKMIQRMAAVAKQHGTRAKLYLSQTQDAKSNPLAYAAKIKIATKAFGKLVDVIHDPSIKTFFDLPRSLNGTVQHLIVVAGSDRLPEYKKKLEAYNGKEYTFDKIEVVSAGERDPDADGAEGMSASKARALAKVGDVEAFKEALPTSVRGDAKSIMNAIRKGMNVMNEESASLPRVKGGPGWALRANPHLQKAVDAAKKRANDRKDAAEKLAKLSEEGALNEIRKGKSLTDTAVDALHKSFDKVADAAHRAMDKYDAHKKQSRLAPSKANLHVHHDKDGNRTGHAGFNKANLVKSTKGGEIRTSKVHPDVSMNASKTKAVLKADMSDYRKKDEDQLDEALSLQARMKRRMAMNRLKTVMKAARKRALRKRADTSTLERRARKRARDLIRQRILKTVNYADLPMSARARVDALVAKRKKVIARIAMRMMPKLKRAEMSRKLGTTARIPPTGGPKPTAESIAAVAIRNFLSEGASTPQSARLISLAAVPAYEAWCMTRGSRMSKQQREAIREGLTGTVVAPGKRAGEWIVESTAGQFLIPEYLADEAALVAATSHLRITN